MSLNFIEYLEEVSNFHKNPQQHEFSMHKYVCVDVCVGVCVMYINYLNIKFYLI